MENVIFSTIIKGFFIYFLALFLSRVVGKKIITQMNFFDFILGVSMGSIIADALIDKEYPTVSEATALILFTILTIIISYISIKSFRFRKVITSEPAILIKNGVLIDKNIRKLRLTINEILMKLREKDVFNLEDVEYAILERDGQISVLVKADKSYVTPYDMKLKVKSSGILRDIIIDGNVIEKNLKIAGIDKNWLESHLKSNNIKNVSEVFYAGIDSNKKLNISKRLPDNKDSNNDFGIE